MQRLYELYRCYTGVEPVTCEPLAAAGSNRRYYRLSGPVSVIGTVGDDVSENEAFLYLSEHFRAKGLPVPEIYGYNEYKSAYIQEDLGNVSLFDIIKSEGFSDRTIGLMKKSIDALVAVQHKGVEGLDAARCYPRAEMDVRSVMWDLNYFKYCFLKSTGLEFSDERLENDFETFTSILTSETFGTFMYRDFQSRNIMIVDESPRLIDYQSGRVGPATYDLVSFLWQARAAIPQNLRDELIDYYVEVVGRYATVDIPDFRKRLPLYVLFRTMQVLGAYGFRGYVEHKSHFLQSIIPAISNLRDILASDFPQLPYLTELLKRVVDLPRFAKEPERSSLIVKVYSFSYKKGIPEDYSGNGGGFVFDCRAIHNPGRYDCYKQLTGMDEPVVKFLEENGEVFKFLDAVYELVDPAVERYISRGFTDLMVCFGCTGGRHRSVYCAQHLAEHLRDAYGVRVVLNHRERNVTRIFEEK